MRAEYKEREKPNGSYLFPGQNMEAGIVYGRSHPPIYCLLGEHFCRKLQLYLFVYAFFLFYFLDTTWL